MNSRKMTYEGCFPCVLLAVFSPGCRYEYLNTAKGNSKKTWPSIGLEKLSRFLYLSHTFVITLQLSVVYNVSADNMCWPA